mgnify:CR=1 FL=1
MSSLAKVDVPAFPRHIGDVVNCLMTADIYEISVSPAVHRASESEFEFFPYFKEEINVAK